MLSQAGALAIKLSIIKWKSIKKGLITDKRWSNCALCILYLDNPHNVFCFNCPIYGKTGKALCGNTPYVYYDCLLAEIAELPFAEQELKKAEFYDAEIAFLASLLHQAIVDKSTDAQEIKLLHSFYIKNFYKLVKIPFLAIANSTTKEFLEGVTLA